MLLKNGKYFSGKDPLQNADIRIENGKFTKIEKSLEPEKDEEVIDCSDYFIYPGLIEAHCHLGMEDSSIGFEGNDVNEITNDPITPNMQGIDGINPLDESVENALKAGITTVASGPGSANIVGGTFLAWKTHGKCIDDMLIQNPIAMKAAFGENPKRVYREKAVNTRMGVAAKLRELLEKSIQYKKEKMYAAKENKPFFSYDTKLEAMQPVIDKKIPLKCHAHQHNDILTAIRIAKEYDIDITLDHATDGELILDEIKDSGYPVIVGPSFTHKTKHELKNKSFSTPKAMWEKGILFSITTDSPVVPQEYLPVCAALAVKEGLPELEAIKAVTINPAKILKLDDRIGSIEVGKDADFFISDRSIFDPLHVVESVYINGKKVA